MPPVTVIGIRGLIELVKNYTPLIGGATYTSLKMLTYDFNRLTGIVNANVDGTLNIHQSNDQNIEGIVNVAAYVTSFSLTGGTPLGFSVEVIAPMAWITYLNGAGVQGSFALYLYGKTLG